ncbi:ATP-binding protein [Deinococcus aestuarii]|uniref:ATP-binding protein n=1 Tax=Deinococcus aestuarii TaxID=2774531 RepID=UPI001C0CD7B4|nr:tetratricopeptide repeat protein [Deinococcus aestuarii]
MLCTLGGLRLQDSPRQQPKLLLLLAYLSLEGPKERAHLHHLFWPNAADAANSLRVALRRLRAGAPDTFTAQGARVAACVPTDAHELLAASEAGQPERVVELYRGRFLEGLDLEDPSAELEEWVYRTREVLAARVRVALLALGEAAASRGQGGLAVRHAETAYLLPGAPEPEAEELRRLYLLLRPGHSPYAAEVRREAERYGVALPQPEEARRAVPRPETVPSPLPALPPVRSQLPTFGTSFVGREDEVREIERLMLDPACRLLTVVGLGGMGKTRLAVQAAGTLRESGAFPGGVICVNLAPVTNPANLISAVAEALGLSLQGPEEPFRQVARLLAPLRLLLVLDNFEHLVGMTGGLVTLLEACPHLKLLVTSRERLNVQEEWVLPLEGLCPTGRPAPGEDHPGVQLFTVRARRGGLRFTLTPQTLPDVLELCRLVHGSPLAIELAATWTRVLPVGEVLAELRRSLDFLVDVGGRGPARHASLRAVFEHSWRLLGEREQGVLARLSVFRSPFRREAAAEVAGASLPLLAALMDKSLLLAVPGGRYGRHPLLYDYTAEKLAERPAEQAEVQEAHARYFLRLLAGSEGTLAGPGQRAALRDLEADFENLRAAWDWAAAGGEFTALRGAARVLQVFFARTGRYREGIEFLGQTAAHLGADPAADPVTLGELLIHQAELALSLGALPEAGTLVERGLHLVGDASGWATVAGLRALGVIERRRGRYAEARGYWERALELAEAAHDPAAAHLWNLRGIAEQWLGHHKEAEHCYERALHLSRERGHLTETARVLNNLGGLLIFCGRLEEARAVLEQGLETARELVSPLEITHFLNNLAFVAGRLGHYRPAEDYAGEALALARSTDRRPLEADVLETLGRIKLGQGQLAEAHALFVRSLSAAWPAREWPVMLHDLEGMAEVSARQHEEAQAIFLLRLVIRHPAASGWLATQAREALAQLVTSVPEAQAGTEEDNVEKQLLTAVQEIISRPEERGAFLH